MHEDLFFCCEKPVFLGMKTRFLVGSLFLLRLCFGWKESVTAALKFDSVFLGTEPPKVLSKRMISIQRPVGLIDPAGFVSKVASSWFLAVRT